ncbi:MAG: aldehyde-activating protein [Pseudomonadota bacterium]
MTATCICGAVEISIVSRPEFIHDCNCSLCRKTGAAWGYFTDAQVTTKGETETFVRRDKSGAAAQVHSCLVCATTTHFDLTDAFKADNREADQVGVNMRMFEPHLLEGVEVRYPDGANWAGQGAFGYRREPMTITATQPL